MSGPTVPLLNLFSCFFSLYKSRYVRVWFHLKLKDQTRVESMCGLSFATTASRRNAPILGFVCCLLNSEG